MVDEDSSLVGGGDCFSHWHSSDRVPTAAFLHGLQGVAAKTTVTGNYQATKNDDYLLVDTTAGNVTVTLDAARNGNEVEVLKVVAPNTIFVVPLGSDTVMGTTGVSFSTDGAAIHFKSFGTDWRII